MHEQILDALRRGANGEALDAARAAVDAQPGDARALHLLALAQRATGDTAAALESIERAIGLAPEDSTLHFQRAGFLIGGRQIDEAGKALARTLELDPNSFNAYIAQAELAIGRGDLAEAERVARIAARIEPDHPALAAVDGMVALRRGEKERALSILTDAHSRAPDDPQLLNALGFAYLANNHFAFAEQAFRRLTGRGAGGPALRQLLANMMYRQGRPEEAMEELRPLLEGEGEIPPATLRAAGELELAANRPQQALQWLRRALSVIPGDPMTLDLAMEAWRRQDAADEARNTLEAALATSPGIDQLWLARLSLEKTPEARQALVDRWLEASPESLGAHEALLSVQAGRGDAEAFEATLRRILELDPGNISAEGRLLDILMRRDPLQALEHVEKLQDVPRDPQVKRMVRSWLALACDAAGQFDRSAGTWVDLHADMADQLVPLPAPGPAEGARVPLAEAAADAPTVLFLAGLPGTGVEHVARLLDGVVPAFRADRVGNRPPQDPLQNINTIPRLAAGEEDPAQVAAQWRAGLPARGLGQDAAVIDWLLWWDNALLDVIRGSIPHARILLALRDPRDTLLNWLAFGAPIPLNMGAPISAARWLADSLAHVAVLQEQQMHPHTILRVDDTVNEPAALAGQVGQATGLQLPDPPRDLFRGRRFDAGHWRKYEGPLGEAFALLTPVAVRLGYPAN
ncbi:tetratricopeptide repeat protein [Luteimonas sp. JM171]|uniref:tetratricopeptide repeat protein n=1 Tax=Luteimonas sp. JM171 TaxID=1896164 RepID=UPI000856D61A|nr:tetratricopeptide repeat protein [Luteimonas sp. JM171]AOH35699.1 hypothetical protein BGP89_04445 [Luteimonas sp. JM171]